MKGLSRPDLRGGGPLELLDRYPVVFGVLCANLLLFAFAATQAGSPNPGPELISRLGGNDPRYVLAQPWRLLTAAFLHYGLLHLLCNGFALYVIGRVLEVHFGSARLWVLYVLFALAGNVGAAGWNLLVLSGKLPLERGVGVAAGASGAVFGLILLGYVYARANPHRLGSVAANLQTWIMLGAVYTLLVPGIDVAGHVAGAAAGALAGALVQPDPRREPHPAWKPAAVLLGLVCLGCFAAVVLTLRRG